MKEKYEKPLAFRVEFDQDDIITTSTGICEIDEINKKNKDGTFTTIAYADNGIWTFI